MPQGTVPDGHDWRGINEPELVNIMAAGLRLTGLMEARAEVAKRPVRATVTSILIIGVIESVNDCLTRTKRRKTVGIDEQWNECDGLQSERQAK